MSSIGQTSCILVSSSTRDASWLTFCMVMQSKQAFLYTLECFCSFPDVRLANMGLTHLVPSRSVVTGSIGSDVLKGLKMY